jgi:hypothetical protein
MLLAASDRELVSAGLEKRAVLAFHGVYSIVVKGGLGDSLGLDRTLAIAL